MVCGQLKVLTLSVGLGLSLLSGCETTSTASRTSSSTATMKEVNRKTILEQADGQVYVFFEGSEAHEHFKIHGNIEKPIVGLVGGVRIVGESESALDSYLEVLANIEYVTIDKKGTTYVFVEGTEEHKQFLEHGEIEKPITAHAGGMKLVGPNEDVIDGYLNTLPEAPEIEVIKRGGETYVFVKGSEAHEYYLTTGKIEKPIVGHGGGVKAIGENETVLDIYYEMLADIEYITVLKGNVIYVFVKGSDAHEHFVASGKLENPIVAIAGDKKLVAASEDVIDGYLDTQY